MKREGETVIPPAEGRRLRADRQPQGGPASSTGGRPRDESQRTQDIRARSLFGRQGANETMTRDSYCANRRMVIGDATGRYRLAWELWRAPRKGHPTATSSDKDEDRHRSRAVKPESHRDSPFLVRVSGAAAPSPGRGGSLLASNPGSFLASAEGRPVRRARRRLAAGGAVNQDHDEGPGAAWSRENELRMRSDLEKTACAEAHVDLSCDELEVAPGAVLAFLGCGRLARPPARGGVCGASAAPDEGDFA